ncbi:glycosyltransferase family 4 protein [Pontibacter amylolyticus]|uniref:Glycosyl transferase n=1 Tax=Pontibacter amylolyticus TaxID=1424080 RepID=A0ABQ1WD03_9BACT|nr:glycosyltransferase family 4 protein [Pontibacter amylolyticus]GGG25396.1 glycosyl transferase [Pontibacter amylolyticus]
MKKLAIIAGYAPSLLNFRLDLIQAYQNMGFEVYAFAPAEEINFELLESFKNLNIHFKDIPSNRTSLNPFSDYKFYRVLKNELHRIKPEIVISYTIKPVIYGCLAARNLKNVKNVALITGRGSAFEKGGIKRWILGNMVSLLYRKSLSKATHIIFQNENDLTFFKQRGIIKKGTKTKIVDGSGINLDKFQLSQPISNPVSFLLICRLIKEKGVIEFIKASEILKEKYPNASFKILGPPDSNPNGIAIEDLNPYIEKGIITYLGRTNNVLPYFQNSSVFVLPTYYNEGLPRTLLEALATGKPIITTDHPGCKETVISNQNGYLIPIKDVEQLAIAMERYINSDQLIEKHGKESRKLAESKFDVNIINKDMINFIEV